MATVNRVEVEMTLQNLCVELENLCQVKGSFDEVDIAALESCQIKLNQLINNKKEALMKARTFKRQLVG